MSLEVSELLCQNKVNFKSQNWRKTQGNFQVPINTDDNEFPGKHSSTLQKKHVNLYID